MVGLLVSALTIAGGIAGAPTLALQTAPPIEQKLCSLNVVDWELSSILRALSEQSGANLVLLSGESKKLTVRLQSVPLREMLEHLCAMSGLSMLRIGGTYAIATAEQLKAGYPEAWRQAYPEIARPAEPVVTETFTSSYVLANQIAEALRALFGPEGLIVVPGPIQISPELANRSTESSTGTASDILTNQRETAQSSGRTLMMRGPKALVAEALEAARRMDNRREQVSIQVTVHDVNEAAEREMGLSWSFSGISVSETPSGFNFGRFTRSGFGAANVIKALETLDGVKLLASPNIAVLDGEKAFILIGQKLNFPILIGYSQANTPIFDRQEERVGIYLQVAASISSDGQITLSLYPQVSTVTGFLEVNGASYPQITTREAQTTVRVKSGETVALGGLIRDEELRTLEKVPLLGDIPILGELFRRRRVMKEKSQVLITLTPTILPAAGTSSNPPELPTNHESR